MEVTPATWEKAIEQPADNAFFSVHKPEFSVDFLWKECGEAEWHSPGRIPVEGKACVTPRHAGCSFVGNMVGEGGFEPPTPCL